ncbi:hypothetical protein [Lentzea cavernae]|uniref:Dynamin family protein n=1 Tax=Lentzea cavernae TaxID=2020703 RepID=A0ABQ3MLK9_9PSEU|nr:hypothetical protein [Lentzea cavernae]GHH42677.1 hypothetical protein GCM10017774_39430 [Lentzea cavernae]
MTQAITDDMISIAEAHHWKDISEFLRGAPPSDDQTVLLLTGSGADATEFAERMRAPVRTTALASVRWETVLSASRIVAFVELGATLTLDEVRLLENLLALPADARCLVLRQRDDMSPEDVDAALKGLWRVLFAQPNERWRGQDLRENGCLTWHRDAAEIDEWLTEPRPDPLPRLRLHHALTTMEKRAEALPARPAADHVHLLSEIGSHERALASILDDRLNLLRDNADMAVRAAELTLLKSRPGERSRVLDQLTGDLRQLAVDHTDALVLKATRSLDGLPGATGLLTALHTRPAFSEADLPQEVVAPPTPSRDPTLGLITAGATTLVLRRITTPLLGGATGAVIGLIVHHLRRFRADGDAEIAFRRTLSELSTRLRGDLARDVDAHAAELRAEIARRFAQLRNDLPAPPAGPGTDDRLAALRERLHATTTTEEG